MKYSKKQIYSIYFSFILLIALAIITLLTQLQKPEVNPVVNDGLYAFYTLFNGNRIMIFFFIGLVILISNIFPIIYFKYFNQGFTSFICTRISYKDYQKRITKKVFISAFCFYIVLNVTILLLIHLLYTPIRFDLPEATYPIFSSNQIFNLFCYILLSSIGFGFYNVFLLSFIPFIKNEYLYRATSLIHFIIGLLSFMVIKSSLLPFYDVIGSKISVLSSFMVPLNLYTPGLFFEEEGFLAFTLSIIFYGVVTFILFKLSYKKVMHDE